MHRSLSLTLSLFISSHRSSHRRSTHRSTVWFCISAPIDSQALRVAFIHVEESGAADGTVLKEFYSKLVKADVHGKDQGHDEECNAFSSQGNSSL
ncbi:unnamed protein product [Camellia sinensis]